MLVPVELVVDVVLVIGVVAMVVYQYGFVS